MNELGRPFYFTDNIKTVQKLGGTASYFGPSSELSVPENAEIIHKLLIKTAKKEKKPLIVFAHSKAAAETYYAILTHPELILNNTVWQMLSVQGAIWGSPLCDDPPGLLLNLFMNFMTPDIGTLSTYYAKININ